MEKVYCIGCDFTSAVLKNSVFLNADFRGVSLRNAVCIDSNFNGVDFRHTGFDIDHINTLKEMGAPFNFHTMNNISEYGADLYNVEFTNVTLKKARLNERWKKLIKGYKIIFAETIIWNKAGNPGGQ